MAEQPTVFFESLGALRVAERLNFPQSLDDYRQANTEGEYLEAFVCPAQDGYITNHRHAYKGPDGRFYHSRDCADVTDLMEAQ